MNDYMEFKAMLFEQRWLLYTYGPPFRFYARVYDRYALYCLKKYSQ